MANGRLLDSFVEKLQNASSWCWSIFGGFPEKDPIKINSNDDVKNLKERQIVVDENGKYFRVRKQWIPSSYTGIFYEI